MQRPRRVSFVDFAKTAAVVAVFGVLFAAFVVVVVAAAATVQVVSLRIAAETVWLCLCCNNCRSHCFYCYHPALFSATSKPDAFM